MNARDDARYRLGNGNWAGLAQSGLSLADLLEAAEEWAAPLAENHPCQGERDQRLHLLEQIRLVGNA